ncbi:MAG TPA: Ig-like domain-containing protein, partial [Nitrososphaera sp.]
APATISITVNGTNDAPVADGQSVTTDEDEDVTFTLTGSDVESSALTFGIVTDPAEGTLSGFNSTTGEVTYTPNANFNGADSFTFVVNDGTDNSTAAIVSITVNPVAEQDEDDDEDGDRHRSSGGGGGGDRVVIINSNSQQQNGGSSSSSCATGTLPNSHFQENPLDRIVVCNPSFLDQFGIGISQTGIDQQVSITGTLSNRQQIAQDYAFIVQITGKDGGAVVFIGWQNGNIESGNTADISLSWTPEEAGDYMVRIFVWDKLQPPAQPLSTVTTMNIEVTG